MRGTVAKALRRAAYGDQSLRARTYTVERHRGMYGRYTLHVADPGRVAMNAAKRQRADRSTPDPKGARRAELAEKRKAGRRKAREKARRKPAPPPTVAEIIGGIAVDMVTANAGSAS